MKATDLLSTQHRDVEQLFEQLENVEEGDRRTVREELARNLVAHAAIEEEIFYPAIREAMRKDVIAALEEHGMAALALHKLLLAPTDDERFEARCKVLKDLVLHHLQEEEKNIFPRAESALGEEAMSQIGERLEVRFEECLGGDIRGMLRQSLLEGLEIQLPQAPAKKAAVRRVPAKKVAGAKRGAGAKRAAATTRRPATGRASTTKRAASSTGTRKAAGSRGGRSSRSGGSSRSRSSR